MLVVRTPLAGCSLLIPDSCRYLKCTEFGCLLHSRRGRQEQCPDWAIRGVRPKTASRDSALAVFQDCQVPTSPENASAMRWLPSDPATTDTHHVYAIFECQKRKRTKYVLFMCKLFHFKFLWTKGMSMM